MDIRQNSQRLRLNKVISEMHNYVERTDAELKTGIKKQAKDLAWFFSLFVLYVMFGLFLFFYVEECSDGAMADDGSAPSLWNKNVYVPMKNVSWTCEQLLLAWKRELLTDTNRTMFNSTDLQKFHSVCKHLLQSSLSAYVIDGYKRACILNEFQLLKYAEFCIFTLLTIGYGNTTPKTILGRYLLILYAVIGVPIAVTMYSVAGKLLVQIYTSAVNFVDMRLFGKKSSTKILRYKLLALSVITMFIIMIIGSAITGRSDMENFSFHSSLYFWFVSLTTIGYGDIHFDREKHLTSPHWLLLSASNLLFGLGISAAIIEAFALALEQRRMDNMMEVDDERVCVHLSSQINDKTRWIANSVTLGAILLDLSSNDPRKKKFSETLSAYGYRFDQVESGNHAE